MIRLLAILFFLLSIFTSSAAGQPTDIFTQTQRIGRGAVLNAQWHPGGNLILVDTVTGAWLYDNTLADVAHLPDIRLAKFNSDGKIIAGIDAANNLTFWDSATYTQIDSYVGNTAYVTALEWSPNQSQIATLDRSGRILVWDLATTAIQFETRLNGADQIAWSKNGSYLAAMNLKSAVINVWDQNGEVIFQEISKSIGSIGFDMQWRSDTQLVRRSYGELPYSESWDVSSGGSPDVQRIGYTSVYSPDGLMIANNNIVAASIYDAETNQRLFGVDIENASAIAWSPDSRLVAFSTRPYDINNSGMMYIVDAVSGTIQYQSGEIFQWVKAVYWSADSQNMLVIDGAERMSVKAISEADGYRWYSGHNTIGRTADWASDSRIIAVADSRWGARVWDTDTGQETAPLMNISRSASEVILQPGGTFVALKSGERWRWRTDDKNVYIWDLADPQIDDNPIMIIPNLDVVADIAWSPDGKTLAIAEQSRFIRFWSPDRPEAIISVDLWSLRNTPGIDYSNMTDVIQWSADSRILNFSNISFGGGVLDVQERKLLEDHSQHTGSDWAWTSDNRLIWVNFRPYSHPHSVPPPFTQLTIGLGYDANIPEGTEWSETRTLAGLRYSSANGSISPQATKVIGFDIADNAIIWDLEPQSLRVRLSGVEDAVWSPDETMLVTFGTDGVLRVIDSTSGETVHTFDNHFNSKYELVNVFWSPDSRKIALLDRGALYIYEMQD